MFLGYNSGYLCNNGTENTCIGNYSGYGHSFGTPCGNNNTYIGYKTGIQSYQNKDNVFIGHNTAYLYPTNGSYNTIIGANSGNNNISGYYLTLLGYNTDIDASTNLYYYSTALGYNAIIDESNQIMLGGYNNFSYPTVKIPGSLIVSSSETISSNSQTLAPLTINCNNNTYKSNTSSQGLHILSKKEYDSICFIESDISGNAFTAFYNGNVGYSTGICSDDYTYRITNSYSDFNNKSLISLCVDLSNNVGINTTTPKYTLDVSGNINSSKNITATGTITTGSDYRIKNNMKDLSLLDYTIDNLRPVYFQFKDSEKESIGLIAHELQNEIPFLVEGEKDGEKMQTVNYMGLVGLLIKEVQELKKELKFVKNELNNKKNK